MKTSLIVLNNIGYNSEHLGVASISAYLQSKGIYIKIQQIDCSAADDVGDIVQKIDTNNDILGFYTVFTNIELVLRTITRIKCESNFVFVGGPTATIAGDSLLADCKELDFVVLGDGESTLHDIICKLDSTANVFNLSSLSSVLTRYDTFSKKPATEKISELPIVTRYYFENSSLNYANARIVTCKKCLGNCSFCATIHAYKHDLPDYNSWDCRKVEDVFSEFVNIYEKYGIRQFSIIDPSFEDPGIIGKARLRKLCELMSAHSTRFFVFWVYFRAETFNDGDIELIKLMRNAGFLRVLVGIEANNDDDLRLYGKRATVEDNRRIMRLFKQCDIEIIPGFIMLNPFSQKKNLTKNYNFLVENHINRIGLYCSEVQVFHKTPLYEQLNDSGILTTEFSYSNPYGYTYLDQEVQRISIFIRNELNKLPIIEIADKHIYTNEYLYNTVRALFPDIYEEHINELSAINRDLCSLLAEYFYMLFVAFDISAARQCLTDFVAEISLIFRAFDKLTFRMLRNNDLRRYLSEA